MSDRAQFEQAFEVADAMRAEFLRHVVLPINETEVFIGAAVIGGAVLLEGAPGTGKTFGAKVISQTIDGTFSRVQGGPDTLPSDITGGNVIDKRTNEFVFKPGPVFANVLLLDELNRTGPRAQSALLEAMGERQVTSDGVSRPTGNVFTVATQNPNELAQGTYPLNVAQRDRFTASIVLPRQTPEVKHRIATMQRQEVKPVTNIAEIGDVKNTILNITIPDEVGFAGAVLIDQVIFDKDVDPNDSTLDGSRALESMRNIARALALFRRSKTVSAPDMGLAARYVLPHRIGLTDKALINGSVTPFEVVKRYTKSPEKK